MKLAILHHTPELYVTQYECVIRRLKVPQTTVEVIDLKQLYYMSYTIKVNRIGVRRKNNSLNYAIKDFTYSSTY